jgi:hypothetical protein
MRIVAGLGNPGSRYASHRHNVGFMMVDQLADRYGFTPWKDKFGGQLAEGRIGNNKTLLFKPQSYMNRSGLPVVELIKFYKESPEHLTVVHDEIDLNAGKIRVKWGAGMVAIMVCGILTGIWARITGACGLVLGGRVLTLMLISMCYPILIKLIKTGLTHCWNA